MSELRWGVKASLLRYVQGMADGTVSAEPPARLAEQVVCFPGEGMRFFGTLALFGHGGLLDLKFRDPEITNSRGWNLSIDDPYESGARLKLATIGQLHGAPNATMRGSSVKLTADGADLFFGPYTEGTALDDLIVIDQI